MRRFSWRFTVVTVQLAAVALAVSLLVGRDGDPPVPSGGPSGVSWQLHFDEGFDSDKQTLLASGLWHSGWFGNGELTAPVNSEETALLSTENLSVAEGRAWLDVTPNSRELTLDDGTTAPNLGAALNTDPSQAPRGLTITYGYVEARMRLPAGDPDEEVWPSFWLNGQTWPDDMEIDVVEGDGTDEGCNVNIHWGDGEDTVNFNDIDRRRTVEGATTGMHTYAADIRPDGITWYYDGVAVHVYDGVVPDAPRYLKVGVSSAGTMSSTRTLEVDHVRVWTRA